MKNEGIIKLLEHRFVDADVYVTSVNAIAYTRITSLCEDGSDPDYSQEISDFLEEYGYKQVHYRTAGYYDCCYSKTYIYAK